ncbi:MAG: chorismate-binding protein, partial [Caldilineaceae bacterium]
MPTPSPLVDTEHPLTEYAAKRNGRLLSVALPAPNLTPGHFLALAAGQERIYWRDGNSGVTFAGMGAALDIFGYGDSRYLTVERQAKELFAQATIDAGNSLAVPRLFGGFAFSHDFIPDVAWSAFHPAHFILPHFQFSSLGGESWLTLNALIPDGESVAEARSALQEALADRLTVLGEETCPVSGNLAGLAPEIDYPLSYASWEEMIETARHAFQTTPLQKVVLSRICQLRSHQPIDIGAALAQLEKRYPGCYIFLFEPRPHHAFLGAPPELLVRVSGARLETMGLAGS